MRKATAKFRDIPPLGPRDEVLEDSVENSERQSFYCVSVPAETPWATEEFRKDRRHWGNLQKGASMYDVDKFLRFFTPSPLVVPKSVLFVCKFWVVLDPLLIGRPKWKPPKSDFAIL